MLYPSDEISTETWRSCCCGCCTEVEDCLNVWGRVMTLIHFPEQGQMRKSDLGRRLALVCERKDCPWSHSSPADRRLELPNPWPARFKNMIANDVISGRVHSIVCAAKLL